MPPQKNLSVAPMGSDIGISELFFQNIGISEKEKIANIGILESKIVNITEFAKYRISECV